jgi:hypothetical protein
MAFCFVLNAGSPDPLPEESLDVLRFLWRLIKNYLQFLNEILLYVENYKQRSDILKPYQAYLWKSESVALLFNIMQRNGSLNIL